jgi:hypothetical protein
MDSLKVLRPGDNELTGAITEELSLLQDLTSPRLQHNQLTGPISRAIPMAFTHLTSMSSAPVSR